MQIGMGKKQDGKIQESQELEANQLELEENQSKPFSQNITQAKRCLLVPVTLSPISSVSAGMKNEPPNPECRGCARCPGVKGGTGAEAGGAAQCEPLQGGGGAARQQRGAQENSRKYFNFILCDVQLKINQVNCFFPLITYFSSESQWFVSTRAQGAVAGRAANNYRAWQHPSSWFSPRERLWSQDKGLRLGSPVLVQ